MNTFNSSQGSARPLRGAFIAHRPSFIARWAFVLFAVVLFVIITVAWFIRYPEVMRMKAAVYEEPQTAGAYYAEVKFSGRLSAQLEPGQAVQLRFEAYNYEAFGAVPGVLQAVSPRDARGDVTARIQLTQGLNTTRRRAIAYRPGMKAEALVFSRDIRLLERVFRKLWPSLPD